MLLDSILIPLTVLALFIASYTDLRTREVPDWINYGLIFAALGIRFIFSLGFGWTIFISGILGFLACFALACLFYYTKQWGGGDSKLLMGMGAVIGISFPFNFSSFSLLWFFLALLFLGALYGLFWLVYVAFKNKKLFIKTFKKSLHQHKKLHLIILSTAIVLLLFSFKYYFFLILAFFLFTTFYLFTFVMSVENSCFFKRLSIPKLTPGDWLAEDLHISKRKIMKKRTLEKKDIWKLRSLHAKKKLSKVLIREGIPFIPSFLLAYLFILFAENWFFSFIMSFI